VGVCWGWRSGLNWCAWVSSTVWFFSGLLASLRNGGRFPLQHTFGANIHDLSGERVSGASSRSIERSEAQRSNEDNNYIGLLAYRTTIVLPPQNHSTYRHDQVCISFSLHGRLSHGGNSIRIKGGMYRCPGRQVRGRQVGRLELIDKDW